MEPSSLPVSMLPTCFAMMVYNESPATIYQAVGNKILYLRGGHTKHEDLHAMFGEVGPQEALTSSMHTRFYVVPSKEHGDEQLVHIRSTYNNKYLVAKKRRAVSRMVSTTDEPNEDTSSPSCTLFKFEAGNKLAKHGRALIHDFAPPRSGEFLARLSCGGDKCKFVSNANVKQLIQYDTFTVVDVADQIVLPPYVTFKGDKGLYLRAGESREGHRYLEFAEKADASSTFSTFNYADGTVRIKSELSGEFIGLRDKWISADVPDWNRDNLFRVLKYGDFFALQNMEENLFCITSQKDSIDCLIASSQNITDNAKLWVEEPVLSREIYNIEYHREDHSRIYDTTDMNMATASAINRTSEKNTVKSTLSFTTTESSKYESTETHKGNVSVSLSGGFSLFKVIEANIQVQAGYEGSNARTWGNASEKEKKQDIEYEVSVPANKKVTLTVTAKQAKYDVPFSYTQRDKLPNGEVRIYNYDDGLYSGMNCFDLRYETKEEEIEPKKEEIEPKKEEKEKTNKEELETAAKNIQGISDEKKKILQGVAE